MPVSSAQIKVDSTPPWKFSSAGEFNGWVWKSQDFEAVIENTGDRWNWKVTTLDGVRLYMGTGIDFDTCEDQALETIGKAYPLAAGYGKYTDHNACKYTLGTGLRVDLSDGQGAKVKITMMDGKKLSGRLYLGEWVLQLKVPITEEELVVYEIDPKAVKSVLVSKLM
jgi:hypothetical protein